MHPSKKQNRIDTQRNEKNEKETDSVGIIDIITANTEQSYKIEGIVVGQLVGFEHTKNPLVDFKKNVTGRPLSARATVALSETHVGRDVALMFEECNPKKPVIIGLMHSEENQTEAPPDEQIKTISAENAILFRCGKSTLLLKKDGTIEISGKNIVARASGQNTIKGAVVHIN
ncbi:MAG: hypothetical protein KKD44_10135 [Proteobacteria bacterium]|nr:hypothetical protein [Pseudomonadota bacterium]